MIQQPEYATLFRQILVRRLEQLVDGIQRQDGLVTQAERNEALHVLTYGLDWEPAWPVTRQLLLLLMPLLEQAGHRDDLLAYLETGLAICDAHEDLATKAELAYQLGYMHQIRGRYPEAAAALRLSADVSRALGDSPRHAEALNRLAFVERLRSRYDLALALAAEALELLDDAAFGRQFSYFVQGAVAFDREDWPQAVDYFGKSLAVCERHGTDPRLTALRQGNLATAYYHWQRYDEAVALLESAIARFEQLGDVLHVAVMQMNLGNVLVDMGKAVQALPLYDAAGQVMHAVRDERNIALLYHNYGRAYRALGQLSQSRQYLENSVARWQTLDNVYSLANAQYELGLTLAQQNCADEAADAFQIGLRVLASAQQQDAYPELIGQLQAALSDLN